MKIHLKDFRDPEGEKVDLMERSTVVDPFYNRKKRMILLGPVAAGRAPLTKPDFRGRRALARPGDDPIALLNDLEAIARGAAPATRGDQRRRRVVKCLNNSNQRS